MDMRLDHAAFGVPEVEPAAEFLVGTLGGTELLAGPGFGFRFWQWEFEGGGKIEILIPDGPPGGFLHRFLATRGAGPHHVTFKVDDIHEALARARELGYEPVGFDDSSPSWIEAFLHPRQAQGIVVQIVENHPELEPDERAELFPFPPLPSETAEPVRVEGFRLAARSEDRARRQWETLLGGTGERHGDALHFRWPGSPLRISVQIAPDTAEGPTALEISAPRRVALPEGPHPALGLPLVQVEEVEGPGRHPGAVPQH